MNPFDDYSLTQLDYQAEDRYNPRTTVKQREREFDRNIATTYIRLAWGLRVVFLLSFLAWGLLGYCFWLIFMHGGK